MKADLCQTLCFRIRRLLVFSIVFGKTAVQSFLEENPFDRHMAEEANGKVDNVWVQTSQEI